MKPTSRREILIESTNASCMGRVPKATSDQDGLHSGHKRMGTKYVTDVSESNDLGKRSGERSTFFELVVKGGECEGVCA